MFVKWYTECIIVTYTKQEVMKFVTFLYCYVSVCLLLELLKKFVRVDEFSGNFNHDVTVNVCMSYIGKY